MRLFVERHEGVVMRVCQRMLGNRHDAEDVVLDALQLRGGGMVQCFALTAATSSSSEQKR